MPIVGAGKSGGYNRNYGGAYLYIDVSQVTATMDRLKVIMSKPSFDEMLRRTFNDAGRKVKTIMRQEIPDDYAVTAGWVGKHVGFPVPFSGAGGIGVKVPLDGARGSIGGTFAASGGYHRYTHATQVHMANGTVRSRKAHWRNARVRAQIVKGNVSTMPSAMTHQGGNPPFMVGGIAFTRRTEKRFPIVSVVGLAMPQMPLNRSEADVQKQIADYTMARLMHHFGQLFGGK